MSYTVWLFCAFIVVCFFKPSSSHPANVLPKRGDKVDDGLNCDVKSNAQIDAFVAKYMVIGRHGRLYPENTQQLKTFCDDSGMILQKLEAYKRKCFRGTLKHLSSLFIYSNRAASKRFCSSKTTTTAGRNSERAVKVAIAPNWKVTRCVNSHMPQFNRCMDRLIDRFIGIKYAEDEKKMPFICCEYVRLVDCFTSELTDDVGVGVGVGEVKVKGGCKAEMENILHYLQSVMGAFLDATCGEYSPETDRCSALGEPPAKLAHESTPKSLLYPLYDIIESLPQ